MVKINIVPIWNTTVFRFLENQIIAYIINKENKTLSYFGKWTIIFLSFDVLPALLLPWAWMPGRLTPSGGLFLTNRPNVAQNAVKTTFSLRMISWSSCRFRGQLSQKALRSACFP